MAKEQELVYLDKTLASLDRASEKLSAGITTQDQGFKELQKYRIEYKSELDKFEVYDHQQTLSMIDKQGYMQVMEREQVKKLIDSPYFGRFDFVYEGEELEDVERFYIGRFGFQGDDGTQLIYDWRAPVCNMYYEFELGEAHYRAMERIFEGELIGKRQIKIENSALQYVMDSSLTIQDESLLQALNTHSNDKMKTIVTSIQREQNKIVRNETAHNVIIQGVAGSGKTAVALHRIAYYLYKFRESLRVERIFILSPNKVFGDYISSVLPELGEQPIRSFTIDELTGNLLASPLGFTSFEKETTAILQDQSSDLTVRAKFKGNAAFHQKLQQFLAELDAKLLNHEAIQVAGTEFTADYLQGRFLQYRKEPVMNRLESMVDDMMEVLKSKRGGEGKLPSRNEVMKRLKKRLLYSTPLEIYRNFIGQFGPEMFIFSKNKFEFNDVYPYLYVHYYFKGIKNYELVQHFVLDEMQDYTPVQYEVLSKVFSCKRTILGDFSQALLPYETISKQAFQTIFKNTEYVELTKTYRSSYEIAMYSKKFMRTGDLQPIARHGDEPAELAYGSLEEMYELIRKYAANEYKSTAIICKREQDLICLRDNLAIPFTVLDGETVKFENGLLLTTIQYAKGLEFDSVIVPFVNAENYATEFERGLLYIAATRAMHQLTLMIDSKEPSPLL